MGKKKGEGSGDDEYWLLSDPFPSSSRQRRYVAAGKLHAPPTISLSQLRILQIQSSMRRGFFAFGLGCLTFPFPWKIPTVWYVEEFCCFPLMHLAVQRTLMPWSLSR